MNIDNSQINTSRDSDSNESSDLFESLASAIKLHREFEGMTLTELCEKLGITRITLNNWLEKDVCSIGDWQRIAKCLGGDISVKFIPRVEIEESKRKSALLKEVRICIDKISEYVFDIESLIFLKNKHNLLLSTKMKDRVFFLSVLTDIASRFNVELPYAIFDEDNSVYFKEIDLTIVSVIHNCIMNTTVL